MRQFANLVIICIISSIAAVSGCAGGSKAWDGTIWNNPPSSDPTGVTHHTYHSTIMNVDIGYNIYLPPQYSSGWTQKFPVVYFFHGSGGNENSVIYRCRTG